VEVLDGTSLVSEPEFLLKTHLILRRRTVPPHLYLYAFPSPVARMGSKYGATREIKSDERIEVNANRLRGARDRGTGSVNSGQIQAARPTRLNPRG
jgi:hypothetical protein